MKDLYIVRHGKSSWATDEISDIDRSLKERGIHDGYKMAEKLSAKDRIPELIISSSANRALHSATIFARTFKFPLEKVIINEKFYLAETKTILQLLIQTGDDIKSLMIFGHNPTFTDLANLFVNHEIANIPTTGIVGLSFDTNTWSNIDKLKPKDRFFDFPKNIK